MCGAVWKKSFENHRWTRIDTDGWRGVRGLPEPQMAQMDADGGEHETHHSDHMNTVSILFSTRFLSEISAPLVVDIFLTFECQQHPRLLMLRTIQPTFEVDILVDKTSPSAARQGTYSSQAPNQSPITARKPPIQIRDGLDPKSAFAYRPHSPFLCHTIACANG